MRPVATAALALTLTACAATVPGPAGDPTRGSATVIVDNQSTLQMRIYATRGTQRVRLGEARALQTTSLRIPPDLATGFAIRFIADPIGSNRMPISEEITVWPGDTVEIRIPPS
ncbi:hypothetical protein BH23GEM2_BH23GEM2_03700 [soil metagenome]